MTMERHRGDGHGDGDGKRIGYGNLELSLAPPEPPPEDQLQSASQQLRERPPEVDPPQPAVQSEQQQSLSSKKSVLFRTLQPLRSSGLRIGAAATSQPRRRRTQQPTLPSIQATLSDRQPHDLPAVIARTRTKSTTGHVYRSVERTEFSLSAQVSASDPPSGPPIETVCRYPLALPPAPPSIHEIRPAFSTIWEFVYPNGRPACPAVPLPAPSPIEAVRPAFATFFQPVHPNGQPTGPPVPSPAPPPIEEAPPPALIHRPLAPPPTAPPPTETVRPPFRWAGDRPATVRPINWLRANGITHIGGNVRCSSCGAQKVIAYELESTVRDTMQFIRRLRHYLDDRTQLGWSKEDLQPCASCGGPKCVGPVIPAREEDINWLFMLLGRSLGALNLAQLKHFCKHAGIHRTGAKSRLLFDVYVSLCQQLVAIPCLGD